MRRLVAALLSVAIVAVVPGANASASSTTRLPNSMAAIGDSITRAADVCCWYGDHPAHSWSTGGARGDGIRSQYERLRALNPDIAGHNHNDAESGAKMSKAPAQAESAVAQQVTYVTILMGGNDLCTSRPSTMTSVATFRSEFRQTLGILEAGLPRRAHVFVASIPDIYQLWSLYHNDPAAELVWNLADICQSLLSPQRTNDERQTVRQRNIDFNTVLRRECSAFAWCRFDNDTVFDYQFRRSDISKLDYFHPSLSGQAALAGLTWRRSWWG